MKNKQILFFGLAGCLATLGGCFPEGEGKNELIKPSLLMGAAGGETQDQTAPVGPASASPNPTGSAFPASVQPGN